MHAKKDLGESIGNGVGAMTKLLHALRRGATAVETTTLISDRGCTRARALIVVWMDDELLNVRSRTGKNVDSVSVPFDAAARRAAGLEGGYRAVPRQCPRRDPDSERRRSGEHAHRDRGGSSCAAWARAERPPDPQAPSGWWSPQGQAEEPAPSVQPKQPRNLQIVKFTREEGLADDGDDHAE
jgi:hypothetical protein